VSLFALRDRYLDVDVERTRVAYSETAESGADRCSCKYCQNFVLARNDVFSPQARETLALLGIDWRVEGEVIVVGRPDEYGFYRYLGWFHLAGAYLPEETEELTQSFTDISSQLDEVTLYPAAGHRSPGFPRFKDEIEIHFTTKLPWLLGGR
jgi:hypothetical protein